MQMGKYSCFIKTFDRRRQEGERKWGMELKVDLTETFIKLLYDRLVFYLVTTCIFIMQKFKNPSFLYWLEFFFNTPQYLSLSLSPSPETTTNDNMGKSTDALKISHSFVC